MKSTLLIPLFLVFQYCQSQSSNRNVDVINLLNKKLVDNYIFLDVAEQMAHYVRAEYNKGSYSNLDDDQLARQLTIDLRSISNDKHLRIRTSTFTPSNGRRREVPYYTYNIGYAKILENNIGYLEITGFLQPYLALKEHLAMQMKKLEQTDAMILDLRNNGGGSPEGVQLLTSYFMEYQKGKIINSLYYRNTDSLTDFEVLENLDGPRYLNRKLIVLTSNYTFSGGEECAYNIKTHKLGTLIGEITGGGAHPVNQFPINSVFTAVIPIGRAINPITKTNWEGIGVQPDIEMNENDAFDYALTKLTNLK